MIAIVLLQANAARAARLQAELAKIENFFDDFVIEPRCAQHELNLSNNLKWRNKSMKARLPKNYNSGGMGSLQQLAAKAQKMQEDMQKATEELESKEYTMTSGGNAVKVTVNGKMELTSVELSPEIVDKDDIEMLQDLIIAASNAALRAASDEKNSMMESLSSGMNIPGLF